MVEVGGETWLVANAEGIDEVIVNNDISVLGEVSGFDEDSGAVGGLVEGVAGGEHHLGGTSTGDKKSGEFTTTEKLAVFLVLVLGGRNVEERVKYGGRHGSSGFSCSRGDEADGESKHACCSEESCSQTLHNSLS